MKSLKQKQEKYNYKVKILIIGNISTGKTSITTQFCDAQFKNSYVATIGVDFKMKTLKIDDIILKLQIWDTAGQEKHKNISTNYYKGAMGIILTYAINDIQSFKFWIDNIKNNCSQQTVLILVGNKDDLQQERKVTYDDGKNMAQKYKLLFFETSAKNGSNINQLFMIMARKIKQNLQIEQKKDPIQIQNLIQTKKIQNTRICKC